MAESWESKVSNSLPENAYRELKPGEEYVPMVPAEVAAPEITLRSIVFGIAMNILWSIAATFLALKVGQGIETAIPISILAVGFSGFLIKLGYRRSTIIENINVLAIGTTSGIVAGGTVFTMPAIYLLNLHGLLDLSNVELFFMIFTVPLLGTILGVVFLVPFRRYFVHEMHGKLPFPEATATNEILVTGAGAGVRNAWILIYSFVISGVYTFFATAFKLWSETFTTGEIAFEFEQRIKSVGAATAETVKEKFNALAFSGHWGEKLTTDLKLVGQCGTGAEFLGLGFIIGVRYASIICAGSFLSWFIIVPLLGPLELSSLQALNPTIEGTSAESIFESMPKNMGIGCIFAAGLLSILKMGGVIVTALKEAMGSLFRKSQQHDQAVRRTDRDMSYPAMFLTGIIATLAIAAYFRMVVFNNPEIMAPNWLTFISVLLALLVSFVFITVSAWAIATISVTPISGMTVTTIIITAVVLMWAGLPKGPYGQLAVLLVGGVVASALSMAGTLVTEFKLGYWTGASPKRIQWSAIVACVLASAMVAGTIMVLNDNMGFDPKVNTNALQAPQANLMKSALESFLGAEGNVPWLMYGTGVAMALILQLVGISPLAFGLGMYLPMELNVPILIGALVAALLGRTSKSDQIARARRNKGVLIASGFIAGAAIIAVAVSSLEAFPATKDFLLSINVPAQKLMTGAEAGDVLPTWNWLGIIAFLALCVFVYWDCRRVKADEAGPEIHM